MFYDMDFARLLPDEHVQAHVDKAIKTRMPSLVAVVKRINDKRKELMALRGKAGIKPDAYIPPEVTMEGLFKLDVDQPIWAGIGDNLITDFPDGDIPAWLAEDSVRQGIPLAQEVINCQQEVLRCKSEHANLKAWFNREFIATNEACLRASEGMCLSQCSGALLIITINIDHCLRFFLLQRRNELVSWMNIWKRDLLGTPVIPATLNYNTPEWPANASAITPFNQHHPAPRVALRDSVTRADYTSDCSSDDDEFGSLQPEYDDNPLLDNLGLLLTDF
jgi:hypothetical protein